jgi:hypothetical protein
MFQSETLFRAIHADRIRDLERAARDHRMLLEDQDPVPTTLSVARVRVSPAAKRPACGDSAGLPA